ncbi:hypothetical protein AK812_SmicGene12912 [Symbiodinium microadriaticum]|uniref:Uncharacterized protein n=1 Tax=Symbiodinium microadriaticum TaxID=2951 RepID=A0A1Q9E9I0_SYMMI|nr:hypothetical protein AK812_SmicGene12912 [Symbiodinium microadriaticum]
MDSGQLLLEAMDMILKYTSSKDILGFLAAATQPVAVHVTSTLTRTLCIWLAKDRSSVRKWPAYVFTLLQKAAVSVCRIRQHTCVANAGARFRIDFWFYISVFASCQFDPALGEENDAKRALDFAVPVLLMRKKMAERVNVLPQ